MLRLAQAGLTVPAVASRGLSEGLGRTDDELQACMRLNVETWRCALPELRLCFDLLLELSPIGELVFVNFEVQFCDPSLKSFLSVCDALVVDAGANLLQEEREQPARSNVADFLFHVLAEVPFDRRDGLLPVFFSKFNGHEGLRVGFVFNWAGSAAMLVLCGLTFELRRPWR